jgi:pimeloyl-ACP methyl ester carboxylesterase
VVGAFLDSPASDLGRMVTNGAKDMGVPDFITSAAKTVASWRYGLDWSAVDHVASAGGLTKPMVIVQGDKDTIVPPSLNEQFAAAAPAGLVQYEVFPGAGHVQAWNVDRTRYETLLTDFLAKVAPAASP